MVNFNFGLGSKKTQNDDTSSDASQAPKEAIQNEAPVAPQEPLAPTAEEKNSETEAPKEPVLPPPAPVIPPAAAPTATENSEAALPKNETEEVETAEDPVEEQKDAATPAPVNPFSTLVKKAEERETVAEKPAPEATSPQLVNPFAKAEPTIPQENQKEVVEAETPVEMTKAESPFSVPVETKSELVEEKISREEKKEEPKESKNPFSKVIPVGNKTEKEISVPHNPTDKDPLQTVSQVKKDIVSFVEFHQNNIQKLQNDMVSLKKKHQEDMQNLERKIQDERRLLKEKGASYAQMLQELQGLTHNFETSNNEQNGKHQPAQKPKRQFRHAA